jgi:hypothetical protein
MIGRRDWAEVEGFAAIMSFMVFENHGPAIEAGVRTVGSGVEERDAVSGLRLLAPSQCADSPRPALVFPNFDPESLWLPILLIDLIEPIAHRSPSDRARISQTSSRSRFQSLSGRIPGARPEHQSGSVAGNQHFMQAHCMVKWRLPTRGST